MPRTSGVSCTILLCGLALTACWSRGSGTGALGAPTLRALAAVPPHGGEALLDDTIAIVFSDALDPASVSEGAITFQVADRDGRPLDEQPAGRFDLADGGRLLRFEPSLPRAADLSDGGLRADRRYRVSVAPPSSPDALALRDLRGRPLAEAFTFEFTTPRDEPGAALFARHGEHGPRVVELVVSPSDANGAELGRFGRGLVELRARFDRPLDPRADNLPRLSAAALIDAPREAQGHVVVEYDDPAAQALALRVPTSVDLEINERDGALLVLRPVGILPNNAELVLRVNERLRDLGGGSNVADPNYDRDARRYRTQPRFEPQFDAWLEAFESDDSLDPDAVFLEPPASIQNGRLRADFAFEGDEWRRTWRPSQREVILDTDRTDVQPEYGPTYEVRGGVFQFARVEIPLGTTVRGVGSRPMVFLVTGDFVVDGELLVDGGHGTSLLASGGQYRNNGYSPIPGGASRCGGGRGGASSPERMIQRSMTGEAGFSPGKPGGGGSPGRISCEPGCNRGSAGGGGSFVTRGDPNFPPGTTVNRPSMAGGNGGAGCVSTQVTLPGGAAGPTPFSDARSDNDYWGMAVDPYRGVRIIGELAAPRGGSGGGGGGDRSATGCDPLDPSFANDSRAGSGGAGGGVLIVKCLGTVRIGRQGTISSNGGNGGGGEQAGGNTDAGGGGAGSGGMIVLMAGRGIEFFAHGGTYSERDYSFALSADGGTGVQGGFAGNPIWSKYPPSIYPEHRAIGGFGGMGLIQLHVPPGDDADGSGCAFDDHIRFFDVDANGSPFEVTPARKTALLGWRGWAQPDGTRVDDRGRVLARLEGEGDLRPSPILLPLPFDTVTRARSRWIDLGVVARRRVDQAPGPGVPGVVVADPRNAPRPDLGDPQFGFADVHAAGPHAGFLTWDQSGEHRPAVVTIDGIEERAVLAARTGTSFDGRPSYRVDLDATLGAERDRYAGYRLLLIGRFGERRGEFRILAHDGTSVELEPDGAFPASGIRARVIARFAGVLNNGSATLGRTRSGSPPGAREPRANLRIGFAFTSDPHADPVTQRWPAWDGRGLPNFATDLRAPAFLDWLRTHPVRFVQWDVTLYRDFDASQPTHRARVPLDAVPPALELDWLVLPFRF